MPLHRLVELLSTTVVGLLMVAPLVGALMVMVCGRVGLGVGVGVTETVPLFCMKNTVTDCPDTGPITKPKYRPMMNAKAITFDRGRR